MSFIYTTFTTIFSFLPSKNENDELTRKRYTEIQRNKGKMETVTLTFGNRAENHRNMQVIGEKALRGLGYDELFQAVLFFESRGIETVD